jgi:hypothetical protein
MSGGSDDPNVYVLILEEFVSPNNRFNLNNRLRH